MAGQELSDKGGDKRDPNRQPISVLHVDDNEDYCRLMVTYLEKLNEDISVTIATSPAAGLEILAEQPIDCIVSDYQMPKMNGVEFLEEVRETYPNIPFFLCTGRGSEEVASEAIHAGATSYIQKGEGGSEVYERLENRILNAVDRRRTQLRAEVTERRLLELYEQTDGFFIVAEDWTVTYWNEEMVERTGHPTSEVLGEKFHQAFPEAAGTELLAHYEYAMENREIADFETYYPPNDYWVKVRLFPVEEGLFIHSRIITEEKEQQEEMKRRNHILESFANTVSHDLRNPLNVAEGKLDLAKETGDFEHLEEVAQAHNRMRNLINELLDVARGKEAALSTVSLSDIAEYSWSTVTAEDMELVIESDIDFQGYESQLHRLLENLFWNAKDHGNASTVRVGAISDHGFYVEDDGSGIDLEDSQRIFDAGFSTVDDNPGYGLAIVSRIVSMHECDIVVTTSSDGGARFEITGL